MLNAFSDLYAQNYAGIIGWSLFRTAGADTERFTVYSTKSASTSQTKMKSMPATDISKVNN